MKNPLNSTATCQPLQKTTILTQLLSFFTIPLVSNFSAFFFHFMIFSAYVNHRRWLTFVLISSCEHGVVWVEKKSFLIKMMITQFLSFCGGIFVCVWLQWQWELCWICPITTCRFTHTKHNKKSAYAMSVVMVMKWTVNKFYKKINNGRKVRNFS